MSKIQEALEKIQREGDRYSSRIFGKEQERTVPDMLPIPKQIGGGDDRHNSAPESETDYIADLSLPTTILVKSEQFVADGLLPAEGSRGPLEQEFRRIKRPILQNALELSTIEMKNRNVVMVGSALPGAGKSFCSVNLAYSIALERDLGVMLVDADVIKPHLSKAVGLEDAPGLMDFLADDTFGIEQLIYRTDQRNLFMIPAGRRHSEATELLASQRMHLFVDTLSAQFKGMVIIFDTPPLLVTSEAQVLAKHMGQIILVIEEGTTPRGAVVQALDTLDRSKPVNAVLNKSRTPMTLHRYSGNYSYYGSST